MPAAAACGANAACIESGGDSTQVGHPGRTDGIQDRQRVCSEQRGILCLSAPPEGACRKYYFLTWRGSVSGKASPVAAFTAFSPVKLCQRITTTSTYAGLSSIAQQACSTESRSVDGYRNAGLPM